MNENTACNKYNTEPKVNAGELPDLFALPGGDRVSSPEQWPERARMWKDTVGELEYGGMPPAPETLEIETLCHNRAKRLFENPNNWKAPEYFSIEG